MSKATSTRCQKWLLGIALILHGALAGNTNVFQNDTIANDAISSKVIGGTVVNIGQYPFFARATEDNEWGGCGGSLVSPSFVVTAAHCISATTLESGGFVVGSLCYGNGDPNKNNCGQSPSEYRRADFVWTDPEYNKRIVDYDYALVRLATPVTNIQPVVMNTQSSIPDGGEDVIGMGFGDTTNEGNGNPSLKLLEVTIDAYTNADCNDIWGDSTITEQMVCAVRKGKATCKGDSGGPLITKSKPHKLLGINSFGGNKCADLNAPGVYARVSTRYETLKKVICENTPTSHPKASFCQDGPGPTPSPTKSPVLIPSFSSKSPKASSKSPSFSSKSPKASSKSPSYSSKSPSYSSKSPSSSSKSPSTQSPTAYSGLHSPSSSKSPSSSSKSPSSSSKSPSTQSPTAYSGPPSPSSSKSPSSSSKSPSASVS